MKNKFNSKIYNLKKKIISNTKKLKNNKLLFKFLITHLIFLHLKVEKYLHENNTMKPDLFLKKQLINLNDFIEDLQSFKNFSDKNKINISKFKREESHKELFNKLWTNFNFKEYIEERLGRYIRRIKINDLKRVINGKKIVDFGCGHGNFLISCALFGAKECTGVDYGKDSIKFANNIKKEIIKKEKIKTKINFFKRTVYKTNLKSNYFDFAIQNGVFHHLDNENKAYKEVSRVLKPGGYFWVYTVGGGGLKDFIASLIQELLINIPNSEKINQIRSLGLSTNKEYYLSDSLSAKYRFTTLKDLKIKLKKLKFKYVRQLNGGFKTDFDLPFKNSKFFKKKFGEGDLRILFQKIK